jgi:hypothetical protein
MKVRQIFRRILPYPADSQFPDVARPLGSRQGYRDEPDTTPPGRVTLKKAQKLARGIWGVRVEL